MGKYKHDCYWYSEVQDMQATLIFCDFEYENGNEDTLDYCPKDCKNFIDHSLIRKMARAFVEGRKQ